MKINMRAAVLREKNLSLRNNLKEVLAKVKNEGEQSVIYLYDVIDNDPYWGFTAYQMASLLNEAGGADIKLRINSPGGDVFEARAIATLLQQYKGNVSVSIDGVAASAATYIALAGNSIEMADGAFFMIHNAWTVAAGDKNEFRELADMLNKVDESIANDYAKKTGKESAEIAAWMDEETWFTAEEALEHGFIDSIITETQGDTSNAKQWDLSAFANSKDKSVFITLPEIENKQPEESELGVPANLQRQAELVSKIC